MNETAIVPSGLGPLILLVATSVTTISGLSLSTFLLVVFIKSSSLHSLENSFVVHLVIADVLLGSFELGYAVFLNLSFDDDGYEKQVCLGMHLVNMYVSSVQLYTQWWLTFDRWMKVVHPFTHNRFCTKRNIILVIMLVHVAAVLNSIANGLFFHYDNGHYCLIFYLSSTSDATVWSVCMLLSILVSILGFNLKILMVAKRQHRAILAQARPIASDATQAINTRNIGKVLGILSLFTFVTYIPSLIYTALFTFSVSIDDSLSDGLAFVSMILWNSNPVVDTLTFLLCRKDIKACALKILKSGNE